MTVTVQIYDLAGNMLADISDLAFEKTLTRQLNQARSFVVQGPALASVFSDVAGDGYPNLRAGNRKLIVWEDAPTQPIFHGRIFMVEYNGAQEQSNNTVTITAFDPWMELGYDADNRAGRPVRDSTGNFINPSFTGTGPNTAEISGGDLVQQILTNSINPDPLLGEGALPISITGTFDIDTTSGATDLSPSNTMDWPVLAGDFFNQIVQTGVCDIDMRPIDPTEAISIADPYLMVEISAVNSFGSDLSGSVQFGYSVGYFNALAARYVQDFSTINNKPFFYLGPRLDVSHWQANIAPDSPGVTTDPTASRDLYGGPNSGQFMSIDVYDGLGDESTSRPLYLALYNAEIGYRVEPRALLYITPVPAGVASAFTAPTHFDAGDTIAIQTAKMGVALDEIQRVMGYTKTWNREDVPELSQLLTTADVTLG